MYFSSSRLVFSRIIGPVRPSVRRALTYHKGGRGERHRTKVAIIHPYSRPSCVFPPCPRDFPSCYTEPTLMSQSEVFHDLESAVDELRRQQVACTEASRQGRRPSPRVNVTSDDVRAGDVGTLIPHNDVVVGESLRDGDAYRRQCRRLEKGSVTATTRWEEANKLDATSFRVVNAMAQCVRNAFVVVASMREDIRSSVASLIARENVETRWRAVSDARATATAVLPEWRQLIERNYGASASLCDVLREGFGQVLPMLCSTVRNSEAILSLKTMSEAMDHECRRRLPCTDHDAQRDDAHSASNEATCAPNAASMPAPPVSVLNMSLEKVSAALAAASKSVVPAPPQRGKPKSGESGLRATTASWRRHVHSATCITRCSAPSESPVHSTSPRSPAKIESSPPSTSAPPTGGAATESSADPADEVRAAAVAVEAEAVNKAAAHLRRLVERPALRHQLTVTEQQVIAQFITQEAAYGHHTKALQSRLRAKRNERRELLRRELASDQIVKPGRDVLTTESVAASWLQRHAAGSRDVRGKANAAVNEMERLLRSADYSRRLHVESAIASLRALSAAKHGPA